MNVVVKGVASGDVRWPAIKPSISYDGFSDVGHVGETVVVTANGVERLGTRPLEHYWHAD